MATGPGKERLALGRSISADLPLPTRGIFREHAALFVGEEVEVKDLGSADGTLLNNVMCARARLKDGDVLRLGAGTIRVHAFAWLDRSVAGAPPLALSLAAEGWELVFMGLGR